LIGQRRRLGWRNAQGVKNLLKTTGESTEPKVFRSLKEGQRGK